MPIVRKPPVELGTPSGGVELPKWAQTFQGTNLGYFLFQVSSGKVLVGGTPTNIAEGLGLTYKEVSRVGSDFVFGEFAATRKSINFLDPASFSICFEKSKGARPDRIRDAARAISEVVEADAVVVLIDAAGRRDEMTMKGLIPDAYRGERIARKTDRAEATEKRAATEDWAEKVKGEQHAFFVVDLDRDRVLTGRTDNSIALEAGLDIRKVHERRSNCVVGEFEALDPSGINISDPNSLTVVFETSIGAGRPKLRDAARKLSEVVRPETKAVIRDPSGRRETTMAALLR